MKGLFNFDSPLMRGLTVAFDLLVLNILFIICSIPIVTIGASYAALSKVTQNIAFDMDAGIVKQFFKAFKQNFYQATMTWGFVAAFGAIWGYALEMASTVLCGGIAILAYLLLAISGIIFDSLISHAMNTRLAEPCDHQVLLNRILDILRLDSYESAIEEQTENPEEILAGILNYAVETGLCADDITSKDIFDTRIMGTITPMPREVIRKFHELYAEDPVKATDWYCKFSCDAQR